jgi:hypothetical protein
VKRRPQLGRLLVVVAILGIALSAVFKPWSTSSRVPLLSSAGLENIGALATTAPAGYFPEGLWCASALEPQPLAVLAVYPVLSGKVDRRLPARFIKVGRRERLPAVPERVSSDKAVILQTLPVQTVVPAEPQACSLSSGAVFFSQLPLSIDCPNDHGPNLTAFLFRFKSGRAVSQQLLTPSSSSEGIPNSFVTSHCRSNAGA